MSRRKNVVIIYADDLIWDWYEGMPYLASNPGGSWVDFPQAVHSTPLCGPSRSTIMTGLYASTHGNANNVIGGTMVDGGWNPRQMVAPALRNAGYYPGFMGKYINGYAWTGLGNPSNYRPPGWWFWRGGNASSYSIFSLVKDDGTGHEVWDDGTEYLIDKEADVSEAFVQTAPEPFLYIWSSKAPHEEAGPDFPPAARHADIPIILNRRPNFNEADISDKPAWMQGVYPNPLSQSTIDTYDGHHINALRILRSLDEGVERLIDALTARGILDDTIIIFFGDNMNLFGEHRHYSKGWPHEDVINMALKVRWPGHVGGSNDALVCNIDIVPTLLDIARARQTYAPEGMSIVPLLDGTVAAEDFRDAVLLVRQEENPVQFGKCPTYRGIRTATHKYVEYFDSGAGQREMYDLVADPYEMTNIAETDPILRAELAAQLAALRAGVNDDLPAGA